MHYRIIFILQSVLSYAYRKTFGTASQIRAHCN